MLTTNRMFSQLDPWGLWDQLHNELNSPMGGLMKRPVRSADLPVNLWAKDDQAVVQVEVPGRGPADIDVSIHRDILTIEVKPLPEGEVDSSLPGRRERKNVAVTRQLQLPFEINAEHVEAICERGLLTVTLHRLESTLPSKIEVKAR